MATKQRTGVCRWVKPIGTLPCLYIEPTGGEGHVYEVETVGIEYVLRRIAVEKPGAPTVTYTVRPGRGVWACSCPDASRRGYECKHARAVRAAISKAPF